MAAVDFDSTDVPPSTGFDPIPAGKYKAAIVASEEKPTRNGNGSYLQLTFEVTDGDHAGRKLWARLNLNNPSEKAVQIARSELSAICKAVGVPRIKDSEQLHDLPLVVRVSAKPDQQSGELRNEIKGYESASGGAAPKPTPVAAGGSSPPWKRK